MDRIWAPSSWQRDFMRELMHCDDIPVIPWPQLEAKTPDAAARSLLAPVRAHRAMNLDELRNYHLRASPPGEREAEKIAEQRAFESGVDHRFDPGRSPGVLDMLSSRYDTFLAIQTDAPRKGLPILLTSWLLFKQRPEGKRAKLLIKLSSLDVSADLFRIHFHASLALLRAKERFGVEETDVSFIFDRLDDGQLEALIASCDALISATYGEGFGGPIAEALIQGVPVIAPNHTSLHDLLGDGYPLAVKSEGYALALWQNISVYSASSTWHLPDERHFADQLTKFAAMSRKARKQIGARARESLLQRAGFDATGRLVAEEFRKISQLWPDGGAAQPDHSVSKCPRKMQ
ncbi:MAG: glycosyltransferase [Methylocystis sp.]|nr:glycosyltransferase [Methylocystis sp.]